MGQSTAEPAAEPGAEPGAEPAAPINAGEAVRQAVKVLLLDEADRLLLLRGSEDGEQQFWFPVGGGIEAGEEPGAACLREIAEETGRREIQLGAEVWRRSLSYEWRGELMRAAERYFLARTEHFEPCGADMTADEREYVTGWRWWTVQELEATDETVFPPALGARLAQLLARGPLQSPIDIP